ncbi:hypothetical protein ES703_31157 [subsurface metagenome]
MVMEAASNVISLLRLLKTVYLLDVMQPEPEVLLIVITIPNPLSLTAL